MQRHVPQPLVREKDSRLLAYLASIASLLLLNMRIVQ